MTTVLIVADTIRSPELRHEVPVSIGDPCVYVEHEGERHLFVGSLESSRVQGLGLVVHSNEELGADEILERSRTFHEFDREIALRACRLVGVTRAAVPAGFPLGVAEHLQAAGVEIVTDDALFVERRRSKSAAELDGIRRSLDASQAALTAVCDRLREGGDVTSEDLQALVRLSFASSGVLADDVVVSRGPQTAVPHEPGHGPVAAREPIVVDLFPRDPSTGCCSDITRTFCLGEPPAELVEYQALCLQALALVVEAVRPGVTGAELHRLSCEPFAAAGYPTALSKPPGTVLQEGYFHSLGHGVGLEVHEAPFLGPGGGPLVAGDVVAVEPGCYRPEFGGCRLEDLVLVTESGCEVLTDFPHDLEP